MRLVTQLLLLHIAHAAKKAGATASGGPQHRVCPRGVRGIACNELAWPSCLVEGFRIDCRSPAPCACFDECDADSMLSPSARVCYNTSAPPATIAEMRRAPVVVYARADDANTPVDVLAEGIVVGASLQDLWGDPAACPDQCNKRGFCDGTGHCARCFWQLSSPGNITVQADAWQGDRCEAEYNTLKPCLHSDCWGHGADVGTVVCDDRFAEFLTRKFATQVRA